MNEAKDLPNDFIKQLLGLDKNMEELDESIRNTRLEIYNLFWSAIENKREKVIVKKAQFKKTKMPTLSDGWASG